MIYTTIIHDVRRAFDLSCNEYCVADIIDKLAYNANNPQQWCYATKETIAFAIGITKQTVLTAIERLIVLELVEKHEITKHLRTTKKWFEATNVDLKKLREVTLPPVKIFDHNGKKTLPEHGKEIRPNNKSLYNEIDNKSIIEQKKENFYKKILSWKKENSSKYPAQLYNDFFVYWTEETLNGKTKFRFEDQKYFSMGKRLATFWTNTPETKRQQYWNLDKSNLFNGVNKL